MLKLFAHDVAKATIPQESECKESNCKGKNSWTGTTVHPHAYSRPLSNCNSILSNKSIKYRLRISQVMGLPKTWDFFVLYLEICSLYLTDLLDRIQLQFERCLLYARACTVVPIALFFPLQLGSLHSSCNT